MPLGLLLPLVTPFAVECIKWLTGKLIAHVPPAAVPALSAAVGAAASAFAPLAGVDLGVNPVEGAALGLSGTGLHQFQKLIRTKEKK